MKKADLWVVGCSPMSELYPNVTNKIRLLEDIYGARLRVEVIQTDGFSHASKTKLLLSTLKFASVVFRSLYLTFMILCHRPNKVYVTYPSILLLLLLKIFQVRRFNVELYADFFISLSETVLLDRQLLDPNGFLGKVLKRLERLSIVSVTCLVDTRQNAEYYADYFLLPVGQFVVCPLSVSLKPAEDDFIGSEYFYYFVGTLVPLQGVGELIESCLENPQVVEQVVIRGAGQDGEKLKELQRNSVAFPRWYNSLAPFERVQSEILNSTICLGIFGSSKKADRVVPLKIYQYLSLGKPVMSLRTSALEELNNRWRDFDCGKSPLVLLDSSEIADKLALYLSPEMSGEIQERSQNAKVFFDKLLSDRVATECLKNVLS